MGFDFGKVNDSAWERPNRKAGTDAVRAWLTEDKNGLRFNLRLGVNVLRKMGVAADARLRVQLAEESDGDYLVMLPAEKESYKMALDKEETYAKLTCRVAAGSALEKVTDFRGQAKQVEVSVPGGLSALKISDRKQEEAVETDVSDEGNETENLENQSVEESKATQEDDDGNASGGGNMEVSTANPVDVAGGNKGFHSYSF